MMQFSSDPQLAEKQMQAIIFYLVAFGYIDGDFDLSEKDFVKDYIRRLVAHRVNTAKAGADPTLKQELVHKYTTHFHEVFEQVDYEVRSLFTEAVAGDEDLDRFVYARLKLRSYEIFKAFDEDNQKQLLATVDELIAADGVTHPAEAKFREEVRALLSTEIPLDETDLQEVEPVRVRVADGTTPKPRLENHPFFERLEQHYSRDPEVIKQQAEADRRLIHAAMERFEEQRRAGAGRLTGKGIVDELAGQAPFLDGHVYVHPIEPAREYDLTVLGDLHGCYSCLKAALMQSDFFARVEAYRTDPHRNPKPLLVLLGDYIDRGQYSYNGVLRTVLQLFLTAPEHVYVLRGNHEYYVQYKGKIFGGVRPAEAISTLQPYMPKEMFETYRELFEAMPNMLLFHKTLFVHAGIPRDETLEKKWQDLASLNDADIRFEMLWSDPSQADMVPAELQRDSARFPFGRRQFDSFMARLGTHMLVRGHEKVEEGFARTYPDGAAVLFTLFSAGGATNNDLPPQSSYRRVVPRALTIRVRDGESHVTPWEIDYARYNSPDRNAFFRMPPEIEFRAE